MFRMENLQTGEMVEGQVLTADIVKYTLQELQEQAMDDIEPDEDDPDRFAGYAEALVWSMDGKSVIRIAATVIFTPAAVSEQWLITYRVNELITRQFYLE